MPKATMVREACRAKSEQTNKANCLCEASQSGLPYKLPRPGRSAVSLYLPIALSTLALVLSISMSVYVALNTGHAPCAGSHPGPLSNNDEGSPSAAVRREAGTPALQAEGHHIKSSFFHQILKRNVDKNNGKSGDSRRGRRGGNACRRCKAKTHRVLASHFVPKGTQGLPFPEGLECVEYESTTSICRNQTAIQQRRNADIMSEFWVMSSKKIKKKAPMELTHGKYVTIKKSGQYLIYSQVTFLESAYRTSLQITVDGQSVMRCTESSIEQLFDVSYQSCGVSGVFSLSTNQKVAVKFPYPGTQIDLKQDATYFGLVYLSK